MDSDRLPPPPPSSPLPPASSREQLMIKTRRLAVSNCRLADAPTATSGPSLERTPHDVIATSNATRASPGPCRSSDAQPPLTSHENHQAAPESTLGPRRFTYTPVSLSRDLGLPVHDPSLQKLPAEIMLHILGYLDVCDLLPTSRVSINRPLGGAQESTSAQCRFIQFRQLGAIHRPPLHHDCMQIHVADSFYRLQACHYLRSLCADPVLHQYRLKRTRLTLPPLLAMHNRLSLEDLITRSIFLTHTSVVSRKLARSLVSIRLSRRLAARPSPEALVERAVLPPECVPGMATVHVVPGLVAKRRAIERERVKDGLRRWIAAKWRGEVQEREERARHRDEVRGVGRVWRLTRFWEQVGRGEQRLAMR